MTNQLIQHITVEESTSIQWVNSWPHWEGGQKSKWQSWYPWKTTHSPTLTQKVQDQGPVVQNDIVS